METQTFNQTKYPSIYEINTRVWIKKFLEKDSEKKLLNVPDSFWISLVSKGIDYVWLMGVWQTCESIVPSCCFEDFLQKDYSKALKDWTKQDVIGSPYSIDKYILNPELGSGKDLIILKNRLNRLGLKLVLDFVPNHFGADSELITTHHGIFIEVTEDKFINDEYTYFRHKSGRYFAHGRDPFFPAWQDTIQINYFSEEAREFMTNTLLNITEFCDGVRCDMAMLALTNVFENTWGGVLDNKFSKPQTEFWEFAIKKTKSKRKDFLFIAESYWNLEWQLQKLGFDFTYDKELTDRLRGNAVLVKEHLRAEIEYQNKSLRFIENHDEERARKLLGKEKSKAAAVVISTIPGMRFYHDGQFEGKQIKLPVQLGREPVEKNCDELIDFYELLLSITNNSTFKDGSWQILEQYSSWYNNELYKNILVWQWRCGIENYLIAVNYSDQTSSCRVKFDISGFPETIEFHDLMNGEKYLRSAEEIQSDGLYIELKPYQSHIFKY
jgi:hypothetical protein